MDKPTLIYVLAASHSGSTLTALLLGSHPNACTIGELKLNSIDDVDNYLCSCKKPILLCEFWRSIGETLAQDGIEFDICRPGTDYLLGRTRWMSAVERPLRRGRLFELSRSLILGASHAWRTHIRNAHSSNVALINAVLKVTGASTIVDSSKIGSRLDNLLENEKLDVFVVHVVRDGRAVALTYMDPEEFADASNPALRGGGSGSSRESEVKSMEAAAREWRRSNEEAQAVLRRVSDDNQIKLRYEDLCSDPLKELNKVFEKSGLGIVDKLSSFRTANPHVIGNGMRLDTSEEIIIDERWREQLNIEQLNCFERVAGDLNRRLGYE